MLEPKNAQSRGQQQERYVKKGRGGKIARTCASLLMAAALVGTPAAQAYANPLDDLGNWFFSAGNAVAEFFGAQPRGASFADHTVETIDPMGTTINLFDYWTAVEPGSGESDYESQNQSTTAGINRDRQLKFHTGYEDSPDCNGWSGNSDPRYGIVDSLLQNGYPVLNAGAHGITRGESLDYLFNSNDASTEGDQRVEGKSAHINVGGLLQVDEHGYYYYNSGTISSQGSAAQTAGNYAEFNAEDNRFYVYDTPGVNDVYGSGNNRVETEGMFFPFTPASTVFEKDWRGNLQQKDKFINGEGQGNNYRRPPQLGDLNHYFGLSMTTRFVQMNGGRTQQNQDVTYEFSGDDDVWVFIDDVLVGDLGGIHNAASLNINFRTGVITINGERNGTLRSKFRDAGKDDSTSWGTDARRNTFADDSFHTLKFFYLERGNVASNMRLKFNLITTPETEVVKVDQDGTPVAGVGFTLYAATKDAQGNYVEKADLGSICSGVTDVDGTLVLENDRGELITFESLYKAGHEYFILREDFNTDIGKRYRKTGDMWLRYVSEREANGQLGTGFVISENYIDTGAFANARESVTAPPAERLVGVGGQEIPDSNGKIEGTMFAVPLKRKLNADGTGADWTKDQNWSGVYGSSATGWKLGDGTGLQSAIDAAQKQAQIEGDNRDFRFDPNSNGLYQVDINELPGDIQYYFYALEEDRREAETQYALAFYWTRADSIAGATTDNTFQVANEGFDRQFAARLNIPNILNDLVVQKVDETGKPVNGAVFGLYQEGDAEENPDAPGTYRIKDGADPIVTVETDEYKDSDTTLQGIALFEGAMRIDGQMRTVLATDEEYFVAEVEAPAGYTVNPNATHVYVTDAGVFADAGIEDDGVAVLRGVGKLVKTMDQFAENPAIEATLTDIVASLYTADSPKDPVDLNEWKPVKDAEVHLNYNANGVRQEYDPDLGPNGESVSPVLRTETDWSRLKVTQCRQQGHGSDNMYKDDLGDRDLNQLFSGLVIIEVADQRVNDLEISKTVAGYEGMEPDALTAMQENKAFKFTATFEEPEDYTAETPTMVALKDGYSVRIVDSETGDPVLAENGDPVTYEITGGSVEFTLKHGQTAIVDDLPVQATYEVTETNANSEGFKVTSSVNGAESTEEAAAKGNLADADGDPDNNVIKPATVAYTNTYDLAPLATTVEIPLQKRFVKVGENGEVVPDAESAWSDGDSFTFMLRPQGNAPIPMPNGVQGNFAYVTYTADANGGDAVRDVKFTFAENAFTEPGVYEYYLSEVRPAAALPGVSYSNARYEVIVTVADNGKGGLAIDADDGVKFERLENDLGEQDAATLPSSEVPLFTNRMNDQAANFSLDAYKGVSHFGEIREPATDDFSFTLTAVYGHNVDESVPKIEVPMPEGANDATLTVKNKGWTVPFGSIAFNANHIGWTYIYSIEEVITGEGVKPQYAYDESKYTVEVTVGETDAGVITVSAVYKDAKGDPLTPDNSVDGKPYFENLYRVVAPASLTLGGKKTVEAPWPVSPEGFTFTVEAGDKATQQAINDRLVLPEGDMTAKSNASGDFSFNAIKFSKPGTYTFRVVETGTKGTDGWVNAAPQIVVVSVTDPKGDGVLQAKIVTNESGDLTFVNRYSATAEVGINGNKTIAGRPFKDADVFTFNVTATAESNGAPMDAQDIPMPSHVKDGSYTADPSKADKMPYGFEFGTIEFDRPGDYTYRFTENPHTEGNPHEGLTYDVTPRVVVYNVTDAGNGTLNVAATVDGTAVDQAQLVTLAWNNVYETGSTTLGGAANLSGHKMLTGRDWAADDSFTFVLEAADGDTQQAIDDGDIKLPEDTTAVVTDETARSEDGAAEFHFGDITFGPNTNGGEYAFRIYEQIPYGATNQDGTLTYGANTTWEEREANKWTYKGITYDKHDLIVTVEVTDNGKGELKATVLTYAGAVMWENTYGAKPDGSTEVQFNFNKVLEGRDWTDADSFTFNLSAPEGTPLPLDADGNPVTSITVGKADQVDGEAGFTFGKVVFEKDDLGDAMSKTFTYTVNEVIPSADEDEDKVKEGIQKAGITYDGHMVTISVTITDDGEGNLTAGKTLVVTGGQTFTNTYETGSIDLDARSALKIVKNMTDRDIEANDFKFSLKPFDEKDKASADKLGGNKEFATRGGEGSKMNDDGVATETVTAQPGTPFTGLTFTLDDAGKTFVYEVAEVLPGADDNALDGHQVKGVTYDTDKHKVAFAVSDAGNGVLKVEATVDGDVNNKITWRSTDPVDPAKAVTVTFDNRYGAGSVNVGDTKVPISATKQLNGRPLVDDEFTFVVTNDADTSDPKAEVLRGTNKADGSIVFEKPIEYTMDKLVDDGKHGLCDVRAVNDETVYTYQYTMSELAPAVGSGVTQNKDAFTFTVSVKDDGTGHLSARVHYGEDAEGNDLSGMVFENTYGQGEAAKLTLTGSKIIKSESPDYTPTHDEIKDAYTFTLHGSEGAPMPAAGGETAKMTSTGSISFGEIQYTMENVFGDEGAAVAADAKAEGVPEGDATGVAEGAESAADADDAVGEAAGVGAADPASAVRTKAFTYTVTEEGGVDGMTNGAMTPEVITVTVTDNGNGTLSVEKSTKDAPSDFTFTNTYKSTPGESSVTVDGGFVINKVLKGRDLKPEEFSFELKSTDGAFEPVVVKNNAEGKVEFPAMTFTKAGKYEFVLSEVNTGIGGVSYSDVSYKVAAVVTDNHKGALTVEWTVDGHKAGDELTFVNTYEAAPTSIVFKAAKVLKGRDLKDGEFEFTLSENGKVLQTVKNDANGQIAFERIEYTEPGDHEYVIAEVKGDVKGVTYDDATYTVTVPVKDNGRGQLDCSGWAYGEAGAPVFTNVYTEDKEPPKPEPPKTDGDKGDKETLPTTGDASMPFAVPAIAGATATAAGIYTSKRKRNRS